MKDLLKNPEFVEALDMMHKGYIDNCYANAGKQPPVPESLIPLSYADAKIQKGLNQLRQGAKNALYAADKHLKEKNSE
ncbi:MAG: hypothetical protein RSE38_00630 [Acinetobacter sp.]